VRVWTLHKIMDVQFCSVGSFPNCGRERSAAIDECPALACKVRALYHALTSQTHLPTALPLYLESDFRISGKQLSSSSRFFAVVLRRIRAQTYTHHRPVLGSHR
jgi:hypothetical protein